MQDDCRCLGHFSICSKIPGSAPDSNWPHQLLTLCAGPVICCTAYGKLRLSTFFDVGTDKAAWRRITRVETSRLVNLVATVRPVRYSGRGRRRRAWLRALMLMTMVIMAISMVMIDDNDVDNKFDDGESKVK